ncbi:hypothetical protein F5884DRAFT_674342, partial [Xylogone sp. PMI_703]
LKPEHHTGCSPIILDESYASPETAALHEVGYEGALVAQADSPRALFPMSAYGKPQPSQIHGFEIGRQYPESSFPFAAPPYGSQSSGQSTVSAPVYQNVPQMTSMAYQPSQPRPSSSYENQSGPYLNAASTPVPEVSTYSPSEGPEGTKFHAYISLYDLTSANIPLFYLGFGNSKCLATVTRMDQQGGVCQYMLATEIPPFVSTGWTSSQVPIYLFMENADGDLLAKVDVGNFSYLDAALQSASHTGQEGSSRKRKFSVDSDIMRSPASKRTSNQQLRPKDDYGAYSYSPVQTPNTSYTSYLSPNPYGSGQFNRTLSSYHGQTENRNMGYIYSSSPATPRAPLPDSSWSPYSNINPATRSSSHGLPSNVGVSRPPSGISISTANPPLIRTSTIQQSPSIAGSHGPGGQQFGSYSLYSHKAKLNIQGDLESMARNWTDDEWEAKRRLVLFKREQNGSTITTTFQAVSGEERPPSAICISCIYWEEKADYFVTSVDTIYLLEQLVAARFTVEEKNRIRRNLEGFRPLTVSKGKQDSEEFFKVIMAFPNPKPRNIEKDVKVFQWKDLANALKKIIGKYSASPSSTLPAAAAAPGPSGALLTPVSSTGYATESSSAGIAYASDHHGAVSPAGYGAPTAAAASSMALPPRVISPQDTRALSQHQHQHQHSHHHQHHHHQHHQPPHESQQQQQQPQPTTDLRSHWQSTSTTSAAHQLQYQALGNQSVGLGVRDGWEMPSMASMPYLGSSSAVGSSVSQAQTLSYQTPRVLPESSHAAAAAAGLVRGDGSKLQATQQHQPSPQHAGHQMPRP